MKRIRQAQTNFALGELSPLLYGRSDISVYRNGAARLLNRAPMAQGGTATRPGTTFVTSGLPPEARIVPHVFNRSQRYVCMFVEGWFQTYDGATGGYTNGAGGAPWTAAMVPNLGWVQAGDTMLVLHQQMVPQRVLRTGATSWSLGPMPIEVPPFTRIVDSSITATVSAVGVAGTTGTITTSGAVFTADWVGRKMLFRSKRLTLTAYGGPTSADYSWDEVTTGLDMTATPDWREEAWTPWYGYPSCGEFIDGRLVLAATPTQPTGVWISRAGAFFSWETGANDGDAIIEPVGGAQVGQVEHLLAQQRLQLFTDRAIWAMLAPTDRPITPTTVAYRRVGTVGISTPRPQAYDGASVFCDAAGRVLYEVMSDEATGRWDVNPISLPGEHLIRAPVEATVTAGDPARPEQLMLMPLADGAMTVFHSIRSEKIGAYLEWTTQGQFRGVAAVGADTYVLVDRGGLAGRCLERLTWTAAALDCAKRVTSGARTRTFSGFAHLAGRTVAVSSRGHDLGDVLVAGDGSITLPEGRPEVLEVEVGFSFQQRITPMPVDFDLQDGPVRGVPKRLVRAWIQTDRSGQFQVQGRRVLLDFAGDNFDVPPPPKTGLTRVTLNGISPECQFDIDVDRPHRVTVLSLTREVSVSG